MQDLVDPAMTTPVAVHGLVREEVDQLVKLLYSENHTEVTYIRPAGYGKDRHYELDADSFSHAVRTLLSKYAATPATGGSRHQSVAWLSVALSHLRRASATSLANSISSMR